MNLVFIYGPPGVGKLTVAKELAALTGYKLFHNHLSIDCVLPLFPYGSEPFGRLVLQIRYTVLEEAARQGVDVIYTQPFAVGDEAQVERIERIVGQHGGQIFFVKLFCDRALLNERIATEERKALRKPASIQGLQSYEEQHPQLFATIPNRESLTIDNTHLPPDEAARQIAAHYGLPAV
jgi:predicted kinase